LHDAAHAATPHGQLNLTVLADLAAFERHHQREHPVLLRAWLL
jgi:DNA invertase Pin-like site-specific DNA recombinase